MKLLFIFLTLCTLIISAQDCEKGNNIKKVETSGDSFNWSRYYNLEEIYAWLRSLPKKYPKWVTIIELPTKTYEGRPMLIAQVDIPYCLCTDDRKKRGIFLESNIHAREWISSAVASFFLNELLISKPGSNWFILARSYIWSFLIVANPDGFAYTHSGKSSKIRNWRKTRTPSPNSNCTGIDPNRNFPYRWAGFPDNDKDLKNLIVAKECLENYPGSKALSDPCVKAEHDFLCEVGSNLLAFFSFHSYSQHILLPYSHSGTAYDNLDEMFYLSKKAMCALKKRYGTEYNITTVYDFVQKKWAGVRKKTCINQCGCTLCGKKTINELHLDPRSSIGSSMDWVKATFRTPIAVTFELRPKRKKGGYRFKLPSNEIIPTSLETLDALLVYINEYNKLHPPKIEKECIGYCYIVNDWYHFKEQNPNGC